MTAPDFKQVTQREYIDPNNIPADIYESQEPLILKGLIEHWPLVSIGKTSKADAIEYLTSRSSGKSAPVYFGEPGLKRFAYNADCTALNFEIKKADVNSMLNELLEFLPLENPPIRYIASNVIDIYFPDLLPEHDLPFTGDHFKENPLEFADPHRGIWIGNKTLSPCHYDAQSNIACCVVGERTFTLFPPEQVHNLYPGPLDSNPGGPAITLVDFAQPDFEKFPRFRDAIPHGLVANLEPGDALFIPSMWWHQVEAKSNFNVLINYWWNTYPKIRGQAMNVLYHALLSIKDRPEIEKRAWKALFDYYIFDSDSKAVECIPSESQGYLGPLDDNAARRLRSMLLQKLNR